MATDKTENNPEFVFSGESFFKTSDIFFNIIFHLSHTDLQAICCTNKEILTIMNTPETIFLWREATFHQHLPLLLKALPDPNSMGNHISEQSLKDIANYSKLLAFFFQEDKNKLELFLKKNLDSAINLDSNILFNTQNYFKELSKLRELNKFNNMMSLYGHLDASFEDINNQHEYKLRDAKGEYTYKLFLRVVLFFALLPPFSYFTFIYLLVDYCTSVHGPSLKERLQLLAVIIFPPLLIVYVISSILDLAKLKKNITDIEKSFLDLDLEWKMDEVKNNFDRLLAYHHDCPDSIDLQVVNTEPDISKSTKSTLYLIKPAAQHLVHSPYSLHYYNPETSKLEKWNLSYSVRNPICKLLENQNMNQLDPSIIIKIKQILGLDKQYNQEKIQQRDKLVELLMSKKFENTNSTAIINIRNTITQHPDISSSKLFKLIKTEIKLRVSSSHNIISYFKDKNRNIEMQKLYNLINGGQFGVGPKLDLVNSDSDREKLIKHIESVASFVDKSREAPSMYSYSIKAF